MVMFPSLNSFFMIVQASFGAQSVTNAIILLFLFVAEALEV
jgi:hypothetical protein